MVYLDRIEGTLCNILKLINQVKLHRAITVLFWLTQKVSIFAVTTACFPHVISVFSAAEHFFWV